MTKCTLCRGLGYVVVASRSGYHLSRQCPACKGEGTYEPGQSRVDRPTSKEDR